MKAEDFVKQHYPEAYCKKTRVFHGDSDWKGRWEYDIYGMEEITGEDITVEGTSKDNAWVNAKKLIQKQLTTTTKQ